ncbi:PREDICTED: major facilitator superfamily domain-containing protein 8-like, partial [Amphimedon queenslandica]|uniref:Major facilitator superfamily (MFS) profile domain-containing protein n=2 Tax=Amphimedon queenslandica TaxID=400682 RepID=A0AAN0K4H7_AMPQE
MSETDPLLPKRRESNGYANGSTNHSVNLSESVVDVTGLTRADDVPLKVKESKGRRISLYVLYFTMFLGSVTFSVVISSIYPYLQKITNNTSSTSFLGYIVAIYSLGQLLSSPLFGLWSDYQHAMVPLQTGLMMTVVFNILYCYAVVFSPTVGKIVLLVSRALIGAGAGTVLLLSDIVCVFMYCKGGFNE